MQEERCAAGLRHALLSQVSSIPTPALLEFPRVADMPPVGLGAVARDMLENFSATSELFDTLHHSPPHEIAEQRHSEGNDAMFGAVNHTLTDQAVARGASGVG